MEQAGLQSQTSAAAGRRGTVIGVLKAFLGLSGSFFTTVYVSFLEPDATAFLLMLALLPSAIVLACTLFINYVPYIQVEPHTKVIICRPGCHSQGVTMQSEGIPCLMRLPYPSFLH